ncbi:MAG TPA: PKD domain-containing protein [Flavisolibacter sp.]|nr:PKD domain-containing protein [Flavisolibacter sp.]
MNTSTIYTKRSKGLDKRVWFTLLVTCSLCTLFLGYTYITHKSCTLSSVIKASTPSDPSGKYLPGETVWFQLSEPVNRPITWDFGDGSDPVKGDTVDHQFMSAGIYKVKATILDSCMLMMDVRIKSTLYTGMATSGSNEIYGENRLEEGARGLYYSVVEDAQAYEWVVSGGKDPQRQTNSIGVFHFRKAGDYTIQLTINNDPATRTIKKVKVVKATPQIPEDLFADGDGKNAGGQDGISESDGPMPWGTSEKVSNDRETSGGSDNTQEAVPPKLTETQGPKPSTIDPKPTETKEDNPPNKKVPHPDTFKEDLIEVIYNDENMEELYKYLQYEETTKVKVLGEKEEVPLPAFIKEMRKERNNYRITDIKFWPAVGPVQTIIVTRERLGVGDKVRSLFKKNE